MATQTHWTSQTTCKHFTEISAHENAVRIEQDFFRADQWMRFWCQQAENTGRPAPDLVMLYEYLKEPGKVIHITANVAYQTIQFLKETN